MALIKINETCWVDAAEVVALVYDDTKRRMTILFQNKETVDIHECPQSTCVDVVAEAINGAS